MTTTPTVPSIRVSIAAPVPVPVPTDEVLFIIAPHGTDGGSLNAGEVSEPVNYLTPVRQFIGSTGLYADAMGTIFTSVNPTVELTVAGSSAAPTIAEWESAIDTIRQMQNQPSIIALVGLNADTPAAAAINKSAGVKVADPNITVDGGSLEVDKYYRLNASAAGATGPYEIVRVSRQVSTNVYALDRGQFGTSAMDADDDAPLMPIEHPVVSRLATLANEMGANAIVDSFIPSLAGVASERDKLIQARAFAAAFAEANGQRHVLPIFNGSDDVPATAHWLNGVLQLTRRFGRQRGIEYAQVPTLTADTIQYKLSFSPNPDVESDIKFLVEHYVSALAIRGGSTHIFGDSFKGVGSVLRFWSVSHVLDYFDFVMKRTAERWFGRATNPSNLSSLSNALQDAANTMIGSGELVSATIRPDPERNNDVARQAGIVYMQATLGISTPTETVIITTILEI